MLWVMSGCRSTRKFMRQFSKHHLVNVILYISCQLSIKLIFLLHHIIVIISLLLTWLYGWNIISGHLDNKCVDAGNHVLTDYRTGYMLSCPRLIKWNYICPTFTPHYYFLALKYTQHQCNLNTFKPFIILRWWTYLVLAHFVSL